VREIGERIFVHFKTHVLNCRGTKFKDSCLEKILSADAFTGEEAKNLGLIDEFGIFEEFSKQKYPGIKVVDFSKSSPWETAF
jgi:ClpP class serine protease